MAFHLDFETRSVVQPKDVGQVAYARHPTTDVLVICAAKDDEPVVADSGLPRDVWLPWFRRFDTLREGMPFWIMLVESDEPIYAHNAAFEAAIWEHILHRRYGWPAIDPSRWRCTAAIASTYALPRSLEQVAVCLDLLERKDEEGHQLMKKMSKPRKATAEEKRNAPEQIEGVLLWHEDPADLERLTAYCRQDVVVEREVHRRLGDLPPDELRVWQLDQRINRKGVPVDLDLCRGALEVRRIVEGKNNAELREICGTPAEGSKELPERTSQVDRLKRWIQGAGWILPNFNREETLDPILDDEKEVKRVGGGKGTPQGSVRRVLELRRENSKASVAKFQAALDRHVSVRWDPVLPILGEEIIPVHARVYDSLLYGGAHTLRWAGQGVQIQNMPRGKVRPWLYEFACALVAAADIRGIELLWEDAMSLLRSCVRGIIRAPEGRVLVVCDFAAIEARILFWLAGEETGLRLFREKDAGLTNVGPYLWMAGRIYGRDPEDIHRDRKAKCPIAEDQRYYGKQSILGCGYGLGAKKYRDMYGGTPKLAAASVRAYREGFPRVPELWEEIGEAAIEAARGARHPVPCCGGKVHWGLRDGYLCARLPSGRLLRYPDPRVGTHTITVEILDDKTGAVRTREVTVTEVSHRVVKNRRWTRRWSGGRVFLENVDQAIARDLLAAAMLRTDDHPAWRDTIVMHAHDEEVCEVPDEGAAALERRRRELERIMCDSPAWAEGCPIAAEAWVGPRYRK